MRRWFSNAAVRPLLEDGAGPQSAARDLHRSLPEYRPTPLVDLPTLATQLGAGRLLVKDESSRLGLPAFKALGASWACRQVLDRSAGAELVTATDGNHGRAVARTAAQLGTTATVFVPVVMPSSTVALIVSEGARVEPVDGDYDVAVRAAAAYADAAGDRELVQDTAWEGYEEVPRWIVEGYSTMPEEVDEALGRQPDLVVVPAGVGSLAQAVVGHYRRVEATRTRVLVVEPATAACVLASLEAGGRCSVPTGTTVLAGMNCGTVSTLAWPVLRDGLDAAVTVTDDEALQASADLGAFGVSSGPCGAATLAAARASLGDPDHRADLDLPDEAVVVLLSTEGTDSA